jgi:predicted aldo/keto reductase-like oxidoreductase
MSSRLRWVVIASLCVAAAVGFVLGGSLLWLSFEDVGPTAWWLGPEIQALITALVSGVRRVVVGPVWLGLLIVALGLAAGLAVRAAARQESAGPTGSPANVGRRSLLTGIAAGLAATGGAVARAFFGIGASERTWWPVFSSILGDQPDIIRTHPDWQPRWNGSRVQAHRRMGRTGWNVSDIALGAGRISGEQGVSVLRAALDRGVNYVDTAPDYSAEGSERAVGEALQGRRQQVFLATKFCTPLGNLPAGTPVADYKAAVEQSLGRLRTDYVDLIHIHGVDSLDRLLDPNVHEAFDRLREEGKARFLGFSSHTPRLVEVANAAIDSRRFDVMMLAYHHGIWPEMAAVIERARRDADMGIVAMKTLKGAKHRGLLDFAEHADAYSQAALRWALSNEHVSSAIISFWQPQHVEEYLYASGKRLGAEDVATLERYDELTAGTHCAPHCGACLDACPAGLPIHDVLRFRMYFEDYGWEKEGIGQYAKLGAANASVCASCPAPCANSCPLGIDIQQRMTGAHELLTLG